MQSDAGAAEFAERVVVITGASSAIGDALATRFAAGGARIVLADIAPEGMEGTRERLTGAGHVARAVRVDVTRCAEVEALIEGAFAEYGRLDVVANLAGVIHDAHVVDLTEEALDRVFAVNQKGLFFCCQAAARVMQREGRGSIVNMASLGAFTPIPMLAAYAMSKAAVVALTRVLAAEVGAAGVRVNAVAPGYVEGGMTTRGARRADGSIDAEKLGATREKARRRTALGITGTPAHIAEIFAFLASDASQYMTGQVLHANGGSHMP